MPSNSFHSQAFHPSNLLYSSGSTCCGPNVVGLSYGWSNPDSLYPFAFIKPSGTIQNIGVKGLLTPKK